MPSGIFASDLRGFFWYGLSSGNQGECWETVLSKYDARITEWEGYK